VNEIDDIRQQMAQIRHDLHHDVSGVVSGVAEVMDWRSALRRHPWATVGAAFLSGYLLVPRRNGTTAQAAQGLIAMPSDPEERSAPSAGLAGRTMRLLWPIAEQAIQSYALFWINGRIKQHLERNGAVSHRFNPEQGQPERQRAAPIFQVPDNDR
jgi:hypothetical protein